MAFGALWHIHMKLEIIFIDSLKCLLTQWWPTPADLAIFELLSQNIDSAACCMPRTYEFFKLYTGFLSLIFLFLVSSVNPFHYVITTRKLIKNWKPHYRKMDNFSWILTFLYCYSYYYYVDGFRLIFVSHKESNALFFPQLTHTHNDWLARWLVQREIDRPKFYTLQTV